MAKTSAEQGSMSASILPVLGISNSAGSWALAGPADGAETYAIYSSFLHRCQTWVLLSPLSGNSTGSQSLMGEVFSVHVS